MLPREDEAVRRRTHLRRRLAPSPSTSLPECATKNYFFGLGLLRRVGHCVCSTSNHCPSPRLSLTLSNRQTTPLTLKLHLSSASMKNEQSNSQRHKIYVEKARSCVDCRPPQHAMHFAKRMRQRKEKAAGIDLPLAFKNGLDALSLWTLTNQAKADREMVAKATHRVDCARPKNALKFSKWKAKQRRVAERDMGMRKPKTGSPRGSRSRTPTSVRQPYKTQWSGLNPRSTKAYSTSESSSYDISQAAYDDSELGEAEHPGGGYPDHKALIQEAEDEFDMGSQAHIDAWGGSIPMRPMSSTSHRPGRPTSAIGARGTRVSRPHTAPGWGTRQKASQNSVYNLTEERLRQQVVAECERLTATPEGSVVNADYTNQDISSAQSDAEGSSWNGSKELYLRLLNEGAAY